jgi:hypothetical protein
MDHPRYSHQLLLLVEVEAARMSVDKTPALAEDLVVVVQNGTELDLAALQHLAKVISVVVHLVQVAEVAEVVQPQLVQIALVITVEMVGQAPHHQ